jgi:lipopolysaccharide transport system permease protein
MENTIYSDRFSRKIARLVDSKFTEIEYAPQGIYCDGLTGWRLMFRELAESRRLIWLLILRDLSIRYRQSMLGYVWAIVPPIVTVATFAFLNAWRVIPIGDTRIPYVPFALWGLSVWQLFAGCLSGCTGSLASSGSLVTKVNFPRESVVIAAIGQPILDFVVRLVPVIAVFIWYGVAPTPGVLLVPLVLLPVILLALGLGFVMAIANLVVRDIGNAVSMVLTVGMFLTPVLYPAPVRWPFFLVNLLNPISPLVNASQDLIAVGHVIRPEMFAAACIISLALTLSGWRAFRVTIPSVAGYA